MSKKRRYHRIPEAFSEKEFNTFVCEHLIREARGPDKSYRISRYSTTF